jgi:MFS family permease
VNRLPHFLRALSSRNYRLYFVGQCISLLGNWMTSTASVWLVYHLSSSPFAVGLIFFANQAPVLILAPFAGVWIDRVDGIKVVRLTQVLGAMQSAAMAAFTFWGHMTVPALFWLSLWQGVINALDFPARQTLTYQLVEDKGLVDNVIALNSVTFNLARLIGPAIAGFIIAAWSPGVCYTIDAISYSGVLVALSTVRLLPRAGRTTFPHPWADLKDGMRYCWHHPRIRRILTLVPVISLVGFPHSILAPVFARDIYHGDARSLGFLMSATGVGSVLAGVYLGTRKNTDVMPVIMAWGAIIGGVGMLAAGALTGFSLALVSFGAAGMGGALVMVAANTALQTTVEDEKRGRVMSIFTVGQGFFPIGSLMVGGLAETAGPRWSIAACGLACMLAGAVFSRSR